MYELNHYSQLLIQVTSKIVTIDFLNIREGCFFNPLELLLLKSYLSVGTLYVGCRNIIIPIRLLRDRRPLCFRSIKYDVC